jgi:predicted Zn-dependent peptidase
MTPNLKTLDNKLPVITVPMKGAESLTVMVMTNTGSRYETKGKEGIAHFFEHMVFKGTGKYPTARKLAATIDGLGAEFNAFTSREYTGYYVKAAAKHVSIALDVVSDMLLAPQLREEDVEREKGVIVEEIKLYFDAPDRFVYNLFDQLAYQGSGLGHDVIGSEQSVRSITSADFQDFLGRWYGLPNMVLVLAGKESVINDPQTMKLAEEAFSKDGQAGLERREEFQDIQSFLHDGQSSSVEELTLADQRLMINDRDIQQTHFVLGWPSLRRGDKRRYALAVLSTILGENMSSRLFTEIREKRGLSYYVNSLVEQFHDRGAFGVVAGVDSARITEAISVAGQEFHELATGQQKITKSELSRAQEYLVGKWALNLENSNSVAQFAGLRKILLDEVISVQELIEKIQAVTLEEVEDLAKTLIRPGEARLAMVGPHQDVERFEDLIKDF